MAPQPGPDPHAPCLDFGGAGAYSARSFHLGVAMKTWMLGLFLAALVAPAGKASDALLSFRGGIGVDPVGGINATSGLPTPNIVRNVGPGGAPWRIGSLKADIDVAGHIRVVGRGLLLAGGNGIGTNGNQFVRAILFCGPAATATQHTTTPAGVALAANGDFRIDDMLTPAPPASCTTPVLLITNPAPRWFAAGIPANDEDDD